MATLDELILRVGFNADGLERGMRQATANAQQQARQMESAFSGVGGAVKSLGQALAAYVSINYFKGIIDGVDRLNDLSTQLNVSTESLSRSSTRPSSPAPRWRRWRRASGSSATTFPTRRRIPAPPRTR